jgi:hypothetical protein
MYKNARNGKLKKKIQEAVSIENWPFSIATEYFPLLWFLYWNLFLISFPSFILRSVHPPLTSEVRRTISYISFSLLLYFVLSYWCHISDSMLEIWICHEVVIVILLEIWVCHEVVTVILLQIWICHEVVTVILLEIWICHEVVTVILLQVWICHEVVTVTLLQIWICHEVVTATLLHVSHELRNV